MVAITKIKSWNTESGGGAKKILRPNEPLLLRTEARELKANGGNQLHARGERSLRAKEFLLSSWKRVL